MSIVAKWLDGLRFKTPLATEVDLGPGHIILNVVPGNFVFDGPSLFSAHVYCAHGCPSQLLLSSCFVFVRFVCICL